MGSSSSSKLNWYSIEVALRLPVHARPHEQFAQVISALSDPRDAQCRLLACQVETGGAEGWIQISAAVEAEQPDHVARLADEWMKSAALATHPVRDCDS